MKKLVLRSHLSPGDILMLTAAVRDLHLCYPGQFLTDVRTLCPDLWENNPHVTSLADDDSEAEHVECAYPLIDRCNQAPYHCLHGFIEFLNNRFNLAIKPTAFKGDIHLSAQEKAWYSQVHEVTGEDTPFWIIVAGGKSDITIKWWQSERYQEVIDHFRGKIQFVQVGQSGHHHPKLDGVIDLRGQTSLRELVRLVHHSQGVLSSVTAVMHLAAAVETRPGSPASRPCVVVAGGREPAHWEAYPGHQFIHTIGALPCCAQGGCWRDRVVPLRDGDKRDRLENRCVNIVGALPRCMHMITAEEVIRRIKLYFDGGTIKYLTARQSNAAERGRVATANNAYDQQPLNLHSAGLACDRFAKTIPAYSAQYQGRGIVICGGGISYFTNAWVCINMLRRLGCRLPIQVWHLGRREVDATMKALLVPLGVECVDAYIVRRKHPARILRGWGLKPFAILHSSFREVLFLDADNVPVVNPEFLFETPEFRATGAIFWPDYDQPPRKKTAAIWRSCGLRQPREPEFESGQIVVDKHRCWAALCLSLWFNENSDFYYQFIHGDKETFHLAFRKLKQPYALVPHRIHPLYATMCQHDFHGRRILQHRNLDKWDFFPLNKQIQGFWFEQECRDYLSELRKIWDGKPNTALGIISGRTSRLRPNAKAVKINAIIISRSKQGKRSCPTRENLAKTDWGDSPTHMIICNGDKGPSNTERSSSVKDLLEGIIANGSDYILLLADDLEFNRHIRHNLLNWTLVRSKTVMLASLYNPRVREVACDLRNQARLVDPKYVFGGKAFLMAKEVVRRWLRDRNFVEELQDFRIPRPVLKQGRAVFYHAPSLVRRVNRLKSAGGESLQVKDFDSGWKA